MLLAAIVVACLQVGLVYSTGDVAEMGQPSDLGAQPDIRLKSIVKRLLEPASTGSHAEDNLNHYKNKRKPAAKTHHVGRRLELYDVRQPQLPHVTYRPQYSGHPGQQIQGSEYNSGDLKPRRLRHLSRYYPASYATNQGSHPSPHPVYQTASPLLYYRYDSRGNDQGGIPYALNRHQNPDPVTHTHYRYPRSEHDNSFRQINYDHNTGYPLYPPQDNALRDLDLYGISYQPDRGSNPGQSENGAHRPVQYGPKIHDIRFSPVRYRYNGGYMAVRCNRYHCPL